MLNSNIVRFRMYAGDYYKHGPDPRNVSLPLLPNASFESKRGRQEHV